METDLQTLFKRFVTLAIITDPIGNLPIFLALTARFSKKEQTKVATAAVIGAAVILLLFSLSGDAILNFFGISLPAFQLAGGFIFFLYALQMLNFLPENIRTSEAEREESLQKEHIAIVPLATPLLAGPGAITTIWSGNTTPSSPSPYRSSLP